MTNKKISLYILTAFVLGTLALIYVHFIFSKNNDQLIKGNEKLMGEVMVNSQLKDLEKSIVTIESAVRGAVAVNDSTLFDGLEGNISEAEGTLRQLQGISDDDSSAELIDELDNLVQHKIEYNKRVIDTFHHYGKKAAEIVLAGNYGKKLTDSIVSTIHKIDSTRKKHFELANITIKESSKKAQQFISILILAILIGGAALFWFIINTIRKQGQLIGQLHVSEKKVRESAQVKENFLANMSHEIRTPMNAILGFTNLLQRKNLDKESTEYVQTIQKSGENLLTIINDILDLSKIEAGMMRIEAAPFSIRGLTHSVEAMFADKTREKGIRFSTQIDEAVPDTLNGDAIRLTQILINLIGNALKFTEKGSINIHISNEGIEKDIIKTGITVTDTGIGVEQEKLKQIFDRFQQADDAVTRKYGGTGLGLSIVNDLINLQNGTIKVESEKDKGTSFHIIIPYQIITTDDSVNFSEEFHAASKSDFDDVLILVAEDNEINQTLIKHLFKSWGLQYDLAKNGREAVEKLKTTTYNLVLMDIQMPEMDGYTATQQIRHHLKIDVPIIAMTAHALAGEREKCITYGMNEYISKPIKIDQLHSLIAQFTKIKSTVAKTEKGNLNEQGYEYINLNYMKEISGGDTEYEKTVTQQFIEAIPQELDEIEKAWKNNDIKQLRQLSHNMKTTISVMGLNDILQSGLDKIEYENLTEKKFEDSFSSVKSICIAALAEARQFYSTYL